MLDMAARRATSRPPYLIVSVSLRANLRLDVTDLDLLQATLRHVVHDDLRTWRRHQHSKCRMCQIYEKEKGGKGGWGGGSCHTW
jgi:hypothetical protein